jgi:hypothetical protein
VHPWQAFGLLGIDGDQTGVGIGRSQNGTVEGPQW